MGSFEVCCICLFFDSPKCSYCLVFLRKCAGQFFSKVHVCFVLRHRIALQFFCIFLILVMLMSVLCSCVMISFLYLSILVMFMSVLCSAMELLFSVFLLVSFSNVHVCFVFRHVQFLYLLILLMLFKCFLRILICECIWLFLFLSVVCLFFDTLYFSCFFCIFKF